MNPVPLRVTVAGQTPPPFGGQAVMIQQMLDKGLAGVNQYHVRMAFSAEMDEIGKFKFKKIAELFRVIFAIVYSRLRYRTSVMYYPPAGPDKIPVYRDIAILLCTRWMFSKTIFHFHACGVSELLPRLPQPVRYLAGKAYSRPDLAINLSELNTPDGTYIRARKEVVIPYGIDDHFDLFPPKRDRESPTPTILFVGVLRESKGVLDLLRAVNDLGKAGYDFTVRLVGRFESDAFRDRVFDLLAHAEALKNRVKFPGVLVAEEKWLAYAGADIFCFPTFFESESFGLVALEAMQFELPVVATRWKGVPSLVDDGVTGFLVPVNDVASLAEKLAVLVRDPALRSEMGRRGRERFKRQFASERYQDALAKVITELRPACLGGAASPTRGGQKGPEPEHREST